MIFLIIACGEGIGEKSVVDSLEIAMFHGLSDGATWTYRDDGGSWNDTGFDLEEDQLLRVSHRGDGLVEFRRGSRWADAEPYGSMQWILEDGLALASWDLPVGQGAGNYPLSAASINVGETVTGDWTCTATDPESGVDTYYALFENVFIFNCSEGGLEGQYVFAINIGLVKMTIGEDFELDLVAPW
jgi:hypothetical protein